MPYVFTLWTCIACEIRVWNFVEKDNKYQKNFSKKKKKENKSDIIYWLLIHIKWKIAISHKNLDRKKFGNLKQWNSQNGPQCF